MIIKFSKKFKKQLNKTPEKVKAAFKIRYRFFIVDEFNPILRNHSLAGKYAGCRSINISGDWRAVFREYEDENLIVFVALGTHSQLYE